MSNEAVVFVLDLLLVDLVDWPSPFNFAIAGKCTGGFFGWALLMLPKLDVWVRRVLWPGKSNPYPDPLIPQPPTPAGYPNPCHCLPTPMPTPAWGQKKTPLKPSTPSEFNGDHAKGKAFLTSCRTYICLCLEAFKDNTIKIVWAMSYMKSGQASHWAAREFEYEAASRDRRLCFP
jgi:hypothetical protein